MFMGGEVIGSKGIEVRQWVCGVDGGEEIVRPRTMTFTRREGSKIMVSMTPTTV